jgi:hypothetical protein
MRAALTEGGRMASIGGLLNKQHSKRGFTTRSGERFAPERPDDCLVDVRQLEDLAYPRSFAWWTTERSGGQASRAPSSTRWAI